MKKDNINSSSPRFSVIEGGLKTKPPTLVDELRASLKNSCFEIKATNTRLMGVVGLMLSYNMIGHRFTQLSSALISTHSPPRAPNMVFA